LSARTKLYKDNKDFLAVRRLLGLKFLGLIQFNGHIKKNAKPIYILEAHKRVRNHFNYQLFDIKVKV